MPRSVPRVTDGLSKFKTPGATTLAYYKKLAAKKAENAGEMRRKKHVVQAAPDWRWNDA